MESPTELSRELQIIPTALLALVLLLRTAAQTHFFQWHDRRRTHLQPRTRPWRSGAALQRRPLKRLIPHCSYQLSLFLEINKDCRNSILNLFNDPIARKHRSERRKCVLHDTPSSPCSQRRNIVVFEIKINSDRKRKFDYMQSLNIETIAKRLPRMYKARIAWV